MVNSKLSIIIPFYGQKESQLTVPLASINNQTAVDFSQINVHLVNDASAPIDSAVLQEVFPNLDLHYHELNENVGAGLARQYGIDHSESDYIMFIDADDRLFQENSLAYFFEALEKDGDHELISSYYDWEELLDDGALAIHQGTFDFLTVYARWFSRQFLEQQNIRFSPELRMFEDFYLMEIANQIATDHIHVDQITYLNRYRASSLTNAKKFTTTGEFVKSYRLQLEYYRDKGYEAQLQQQFEGLLVNIYLYHAKLRPVGEDEAAFQVELSQLLDEFPQLRKPYSVDLQNYVDQHSRNKQDPYYGVATADLKDFLGN